VHQLVESGLCNIKNIVTTINHGMAHLYDEALFKSNFSPDDGDDVDHDDEDDDEDDDDDNDKDEHGNDDESLV